MKNFGRAYGDLTRQHGIRLAMWIALAGLAGCSGAASTAPATAPSVGPSGTAAAITPPDLRARVQILAHDSMQGRRTGTPGARSAAEYLAAEATRLGLRPAGDQGYLHRVPLERTSMVAEVRAGRGGPATLSPIGDIVPIAGLGGLPGTARAEGSGPLVFAGFQADPTITVAQELRPEQLRGSAVVIRLGAAPGVSPETATGRAVLQSLLTSSSPASAVLLIAEGPLEEFYQYAAEIARDGQIAAPAAAPPANGPAIFLMTPGSAERLLGAPLAQLRAPRPQLGTLQFTLRRSAQPIDAWNVAGVLEGGARPGEYVALGAHYDHVGITQPVDGDSINNGADDDGSGTAALLEIAERFASVPASERPARSLLFVWHTAEEEGLLGSAAFTARPTVARDSIIAQINIDMIGRNGPDSLFVVGSRRLSAEMGSAVETANRLQSRPFALDYTLDAPGHPERIYCRSDHYNYARYGIPVAFFTTGLHEDYHKPSDEPDTLDYEKLARVTALVGDLAGSLAMAPLRPAVDQPVPPLGTPCQ